MNALGISERRTRRLRKRRNRVTRALGGEGAPIARYGPIYWSRRNFSWWIGTLFMVGSACFAAGTVIAVSENPKPSAIVYFVGSIFFTLAGYAQFVEVINAGFDAPGERRRVQLFAVMRGDIEWQATFIQFVGTLCFNVSTFAAMLDFLDSQRIDRLVWAPDAIGSVCFLIASWLAFAEVRANWSGTPDRGGEWWITVLNLTGSIAFGISAVGAFVIPDTGELLNAVAANAGTMAGALCFFAGAYLLWPEAAEAALEQQR